MLNNCWHRVAITSQPHISALKCDHPTVPVLAKGEWREKVKDEGRDLADGFWGSSIVTTFPTKAKSLPTVKMTNDSVTRIITEEELAKHNKDGDEGFAINGNVYDASANICRIILVVLI